MVSRHKLSEMIDSLARDLRQAHGRLTKPPKVPNVPLLSLVQDPISTLLVAKEVLRQKAHDEGCLILESPFLISAW